MTTTQTMNMHGGDASHAGDASVTHLRQLAWRALKRMYCADDGRFAFRLSPGGGQGVLEGFSDRYTAIALIGLAEEPDDVAADVLAGQDPLEICGRMIQRTADTHDLGEVALALWCARALHHPAAEQALDQLRKMTPHERSCPTVELAWTLTAQVVPGSDVRDDALTDAIAERLMRSFHMESDLFPHWPVGAQASRLRAHVSCFADLVYPIQALSHYWQLRRSQRALDLARRCAERMCALQGPEGQWWWHYDVRTGRVVEPFPVYAVHQDSMAPMALRAIQEAAGHDDCFEQAIYRGLDWLAASPELNGRSLIDPHMPAIWRKVARHEPGRLVRSLQAGASRLHPSLRVPQADRVFPPGKVDYECRPYHMGWVLYAWRTPRNEE